MTDTLRDLIRDTLSLFKDPLFDYGVIFARPEETALFPNKVCQVVVEELKPIPPIFIRPARVVKKEVEQKPNHEEVLDKTKMQKTLEQIAPHLKLKDAPLSDQDAKKIASAWKEKISDAEVVLLACRTDPKTLEFLKTLASAIDKKLAPSKIVAAQRLEAEKRWDLFLQKNTFRLILVSEGMQEFPELMRFYRELPATGQFFLEKTPVMPLSSATFYSSIEHKAHLWKTVCQILK